MYRTLRTKTLNIIGQPEVECSAESIIISFGTLNEFEGHVYVKGQYDNELCKTDATLHTSATIDVKFDDCPVKRRRSVSLQLKQSGHLETL